MVYKVHNHGSSALSLLVKRGSVKVGAGSAVELSDADFEVVGNNNVVKRLVYKGVLSLENSEKTKPEYANTEESKPDSKAAIVAELEARGIEYDKRLGVTKLKALLDGVNC